jgi:serine/threonine protein kinase
MAAPDPGERFIGATVLHRGERHTYLGAFDTGSGRPVVIKMPSRPRLGWTSAALLREGHILARVSSHPHVVTLYGQLLLAGGVPALLLEQCAGPVTTLRAGPRAAVALGVKLCSALEALHDAGFAHGDVRPATVHLTRSGEPVLTGLHRAELLGAPVPEHPLDTATPYTAPELLEGTAANEASDVYGVGVTLYQVLAGHPPFADWGARSRADTGLRILRGTRAPLPPDVPLALADLIDWAMAVSPGQRPPTPAWLAEELRCLEHALGWHRTRVGRAGTPMPALAGAAQGLAR